MNDSGTRCCRNGGAACFEACAGFPADCAGVSSAFAAAPAAGAAAAKVAPFAAFAN